MKPVLCIIFITATFSFSFSQKQQDIAAYIAKYKDIALEEMVRCKIPASITLAQGLHESGYGKSKLTLEANNHFGIKCKDEWDGKKYYQNDDAPNECFRVYDHAEDSYADHSDFLITRSRYACLFDLPITDYKAWATGLKAAGYATNPRYAEILIKTIEENNLTQYDQQGLAMIDQREKLLAYSINPQQTAFVAQATQPVIKPIAQQPKKEVIQTPANTVFAKATSAADQTEYTINGIKAIKAKGILDPLTVAYNYKIPYNKLLTYNDLNEGESFKEGQNVFLQSKKPKASEEKHIVLTGESMYDISQQYGIKVRELYQKNMMQLNDQPLAGETIYMQHKRTSAPKTMSYSDFLKSTNAASPLATTQAQPQYSRQNTQYTVGPADTLYSIAKRFNISVQQLTVANNLQSANLRPGQTLVISK